MARIVRCGLIQAGNVLSPAKASLPEIRQAMIDKHLKLIEQAAEQGVKILSLQELFYDLEAPVLRATGFDTPYPPARLEKLWLPGPDRLLDCVERAMEQP